MKKLFPLIIIITVVLVSFKSHPKSTQFPVQSIRTLGIKINVTNMDSAIDFYCKKIGFPIESRSAYPNQVLLNSTDGQKVVLNLVSNLLPVLENETRAGFTLQVKHLDTAIAEMKLKGVNFRDSQKRKEGVGYAITIFDPFGNGISLMHQTIVTTDPFVEPKIYNYGFLVPDMSKAIDFFTKHFGFVVRSEKYLPNDLPLGHSDNSFAFMLHFRDGIEAMQHNSSNSEHVIILFQTPELDKTIAELKRNGVRVLQKSPQSSTLGRYVSFYDPFGYVSELIEVNH